MSLSSASEDNASESSWNGLDCVENRRIFLCKAVRGTIGNSVVESHPKYDSF